MPCVQFAIPAQPEHDQQRIMVMQKWRRTESSLLSLSFIDFVVGVDFVEDSLWVLSEESQSAAHCHLHQRRERPSRSVVISSWSKLLSPAQDVERYLSNVEVSHGERLQAVLERRKAMHKPLLHGLSLAMSIQTEEATFNTIKKLVVKFGGKASSHLYTLPCI